MQVIGFKKYQKRMDLYTLYKTGHKSDKPMKVLDGQIVLNIF